MCVVLLPFINFVSADIHIRICWGVGGTAAAFLEFHAPLAAWIHPQARGPEGEGEDTLLASGEVYNNFVRLDVWYKGSGSA